jgi:uncharacterized protein YecT (DUF1311 family)
MGMTKPKERGFMTKALLIFIGSCVALHVVPASATAQSFDCAKAATKTEKMVCADPEIAKLDTQLAERYKLLLTKDAPNQSGIVAVQRLWLTDARNVAVLPAELKFAYLSQLDRLDVALSCATSPDVERSMMDLTNCESIAFDYKDAQLDVLYRKLLAEPGGEPPKEAAAALKASQDAWLKFRDAQCEWENFDSIGGSIHPMVVYGCQRVMTEERLKELTPAK